MATPNLFARLAQVIALNTIILAATTASAFDENPLPRCGDLAARSAADHPGDDYREAGDEETLCRLNPGTGPTIAPAAGEPLTIRVLSWNMLKGERQGSADDLLKMARHTDLLLLQETFLTPFWRSVFATAERSGMSANGNAEAIEASPMEMFAANSFFYGDGASTGVALGSRLPVLERGFLRSPNREPVLLTPKMVNYALVDVGPGRQPLLVVNVHMINFNIAGAFDAQLAQIHGLIATHRGPVILAGDFNTWNALRADNLAKTTRDLGMTEANPASDPRWSHLDHVFVRGLEIGYARLRTEITTSDHYPLQALFILRD